MSIISLAFWEPLCWQQQLLQLCIWKWPSQPPSNELSSRLFHLPRRIMLFPLRSEPSYQYQCRPVATSIPAFLCISFLHDLIFSASQSNRAFQYVKMVTRLCCSCTMWHMQLCLTPVRSVRTLFCSNPKLIFCKFSTNQNVRRCAEKFFLIPNIMPIWTHRRSKHGEFSVCDLLTRAAVLTIVEGASRNEDHLFPYFSPLGTPARHQ